MAHKVSAVASRRHLVSVTDGHHLVATLLGARIVCVSSDDVLEVGQGLQGCASDKKSGQRRLWFPQLYGSQAQGAS